MAMKTMSKMARISRNARKEVFTVFCATLLSRYVDGVHLVDEALLVDGALLLDDTPLLVDETPLVVDEAPLLADEAPLFVDEAPFFVDEASFFVDEAPALLGVLDAR
jgi:hypothetical protein